ncbi:MAG: PAS domain-containing sensor histidine kinase [Desulfobacteraceae bacterium 4572_123]|nr:MAG: PAS domain-containing sensor histidine kinase [Desulfobacteraceae bacterium 4572_123]
MIFPYLPILLVDLIGSIMMMILSFLCLRFLFKLKRTDPNNLIWTFLLWLCLALACFAVSRAAGHILKNILVLSGHRSIWQMIRPFSGGINTITFIVAGSVTLFFERIWNTYQLILKDRKELRITHDKLLYLNENLEKMIDERTRALAVSEYKYRQLFEVSRDMIIVAGKDGRILNLNPSGCHMLGLDCTQENISKRYVQEFLFDKKGWPAIMSAVETNGFISSDEYVVLTSEGVSLRALFSASSAKGAVGEEDSIYILVKNIEKRRLMEAQIAQADKLASIGELSSGVAHEINNPLGIILGYSQLLLRNEGKASPLYQDLKTIEKQVKNCKTIVEDLLRFARTSPSRKEKCDIRQLIEDVLGFLQHNFNPDKIRIKKDYDIKLVPMLLDEKRIKQVIMNLVMNALHAIGNSGTIEIATLAHPHRNKVSMIIRDTGHGIEKKYLPRIFDPFFTTKPTGEGTGLGLSVSYGIIKNHGGTINVESTPGKGSTFTIDLPVNI